MHELALCQGIVDILREQAALHRFRSVRKVRLEVGALACAAPESLRFGFAVATRGTVADGAELEIIAVPARGVCLGCGQKVEVASRLDPCPRCGGGPVRISGGDDLRIRDLEVD